MSKGGYVMFKQNKIKRLFENDDPKLVYQLQSKPIDLTDIFKDEDDLLAYAIHHHKNTIAETELLQFCEDINKTNANNQTYLMLAIEYDNEFMFNLLIEKKARLDMVDSKRESALFYAIRSNNPIYYNTLIKYDIDIKGFNNDGANTAIYAYTLGKKDIALEHLEKKVFINHIDKDGNTILHHAVRQNDTEFALRLLELGADVFIRNYQEESALDIAKEFAMEEMLVEKMKQIVDHLFTQKDNEKLITLLEDLHEVKDYSHFNIPFLIAYNAVKYDNEEIFSRIIRNVELLNSLDYRGKSLLMYCLDMDRFLFSQKIMCLDVDLNIRDHEDKSAIIYLLERIIDAPNEQMVYKYLDLFHELMSSNVDVNIQDDLGNTVLMYAIEAQQIEIIDLLIQHPRIDLNLENVEGKTAIILAYEKGDISSVQKMIMTGRVDLNHMDRNNQSLLLLAMMEDNLDLFSTLLHYGADLNLRYKEGMSILMFALNLNKIRFVAKIFEYPFNVDLKDDFGNTALMHAIQVGSIPTVKALLKLGANKRVTNKKGNTPIYLALDLNEMDIARLLKSTVQ